MEEHVASVFRVEELTLAIVMDASIFFKNIYDCVPDCRLENCGHYVQYPVFPVMEFGFIGFARKKSWNKNTVVSTAAVGWGWGQGSSCISASVITFLVNPHRMVQQRMSVGWFSTVSLQP